MTSLPSGRATRGTGGPRRVAWWAVLGLVVALDVVSAYRATAQPASDVRNYRSWIAGALPSWDAAGPYPLGADLLWWPLRWVHGTSANPWWLLCCTGPATVIACLVLARTARLPLPAVTVWLAAAGLLERSYWMRLEPVAALAALLMVVGVRRGRAAGPALALTAGALVKLWPAFLAPTALAALGGRARGRWLAWFAVPWLAYALLVAALRPPHATDWLTFTLGRRTQAEALSALPAMWALAAGSRTWQMQYVGGLDSADVVTGPYLHAARWGLQAAGVVVLALVVLRVVAWLRARGGVAPGGVPGAGPDDAAFGVVLVAEAAVLLVIVFAAPVFSPQYLVWFAPLLAVAAGDGRMGRETVVWLLGCLLTFLEFPLLWNEMRVHDPLAVAVLTGRDAVMVVLLALCVARLRRETARPPRPFGGGPAAEPARTSPSGRAWSPPGW